MFLGLLLQPKAYTIQHQPNMAVFCRNREKRGLAVGVKYNSAGKYMLFKHYTNIKKYNKQCIDSNKSTAWLLNKISDGNIELAKV